MSDELPILGARAEIVAALKRSPALIVCGDTGSGKTTQLPQIALAAGFGAKGRRIACTQPRRLAAVTVAERVAAERGEPIGRTIGYQHRFGKRLSDETCVKFMTDGILLAETRTDPLLRAYDVIIIDEAHERTLNIDFLLGILKRILEKRRDLHVIISSATLETERFSAFFGGAPTVVVPGRLYPIETRYLPPEEGEEADLSDQIVRAVATLPPNFDTLVFLSGERDIREAAERLTNWSGGADEIIPLLASLPAAEQRRAFRTGPRRRIILATNVAETSLTLPGIRAVIDSGLARISRYLQRTHVQRLQIENISQASARQRQGRCGRLGPGICIRLYSEEDFLAREPFTPPEIQRSSLAGVILTMLDYRLGDITRFPFIDPPRTTLVSAGLRELLELNAIERGEDGSVRLTREGRRLARFPLEPRLARMLLAASDLAVLPRVLPIVAALAGEEPRRRPAEERARAMEKHAKFKDVTSDFLGTLKLWSWWREQAATLSQTKLRKLCKENYLAFMKMRAWDDTVHQLAHLAQRLGLDLKNETDDSDVFHRALLAGLVTQVGHYDPENREYRGVRGLRFVPHPSSALAKKPPEWIVAGELVETTRLFARTLAPVEVDWIESAAGNLVKHHIHSPDWESRSGFVRATMQVTLYGLVLVPARRCDFSRIDPVWAREIFIRRGLVASDFSRPPPPVRANNAVLSELRQESERARDALLFDEEALYRHFDEVLPPEVSSAPALVKWLRRATSAQLAAFRLSRKDWLHTSPGDDARFPREIRIGAVRLDLSYRHAPDDPERDGLTCTVTREDARVLRLWRADWLVPGLLPEKLSWMLSVLPTAQRKLFFPIAESVVRLAAKLRFGSESLEDAVLKAVYEEWGFRISREAWQRARLPEHLKARYQVRDRPSGRILASGRDLERVLAAVGAEGPTLREMGLGGVADEGCLFTRWEFGEVAETTALASAHGVLQVENFPAVHDEGTGVRVRLYVDRAEAMRQHALGVQRLYLLALNDRLRGNFKVRAMSLFGQIYLKGLDYGADQLRADILAGAIRAVLIESGPAIRSAQAFEVRLSERMAELVRTQSEIEKLVAEALSAAGELQAKLEEDALLPEETVDSVLTQLAWLMVPGFPRTTPWTQLRHYARYLKGVEIRLSRARLSRSGDLARESRFAAYWQRYRTALAEKGPTRLPPERLTEIRWALEEFRVSLFAQELKTPAPISEKRLDALFDYGSTGA